MTVVASAPGKVVLSGEYAVLDGEPAISMAIDRRAVVTLEDNPDGGCNLSTPGFAGDDKYRIVDAVCGGSRPAKNVVLDTRAFAEDGDKIGIGSSAALTVALVAGLNESHEVLRDASLAHRVFQGGAGSGVDVATAVRGGLIEFEMPSQTVTSLAWPPGLCMRIIWTGVPANTAAKLEKLAAQAIRPSRSALLLAAPHMAEAWRSGDADRIMADYIPYIGVLRQFSVDHDLGIFDAGHDQLTDAAMLSHLVYKPAGAGGGDIGILFGRDEAGLDTFIAGHSDLIHGVLQCALDPDGVRVSRQ
jgi:phosphomevalonate kinase